ncbi:hypothetical protein B0J13DRAFT_202103 [Dactylonectria estremocensis]|uniref:Nucleoside phosphorylase domain-containing protein n=1 Tax=Dactylonectria estremocensis TaxID=1079267 RepID=A0A9P9DFT1_9HYPO|nr:hypothetical protein B0J13DRAFT_202103 [Dactylonectria estremocensis]
MEILNKCDEWCLIQALRGRLSGRLARYDIQHRPESETGPGVISQCRREFFETELRQILTREEIALNLPESAFHDCRDKLRDLCALLDRLVSPHITEDSQWRSFATDDDDPLSSSIQWNLWDRVRKSYPNLMALDRFLANIPLEAIKVFDLVTGPHQTIFKLPDYICDVRSSLIVVTECNELFTQFSTSRRSQYPKPNPRPRGEEWEDTRLRDRAATVFAILFRQFSCETRHEIMLRLSEDSTSYTSQPILHLLLSCCPELNCWQEVLCAPREANLSVDRIQDICAWLQESTSKDKRPHLLVEEFGVFSSWAGSNSRACPPILAASESLDELLEKGAFEDFTYKNFRKKSPGKTFNPVEKRALAVQLGRCLMDFFDFDLNTKQIHLSKGSWSRSKSSIPCLSFSSGTRISPEPHIFRRGDPVLLFFAKLLLEIDQGHKIAIDINPEVENNEKAWLELFEYVDRAEAWKVSSYLDAVRECLLLHTRLPKSVRSGKHRGRKAYLAIRRIIYDQVVQNLETELDSLTQTSKKRDRSVSPPRISTSYDRKTGFPWHRENSPSEPSRTISFGASCYETSSQFTHRPLKRQRTPDVQTSALLQPNRVNEGKSRDLLQPSRDISAKITPNIEFTRSSLRPSRRDDFEVAIICALRLEYDAVSYIFDEFWDEDGDQYGRAAGDPNSYTTGRVGKYNVVLALLPHMGKTNAASAVASMRSSYGGLRLALLVGVCGAMPRGRDGEILLGDVVISKTVIQYDFGRQYPDKFVRKNTIQDNLGRPNKNVRNLLATFETDRGLDQLEQRTAYFLQQLQAKVAQTRRRGKYDYPGTADDKLFESTYRHKHHVSPTCICRDCFSDLDPVCDEALSSSCADLGCDDKHLITRKRLQAKRQPEHDGGDAIPQPAVHVGAVASGDKVIKSAADRDRLSREAGVIALEMEGAGVWDEVPCIVVKGVCDYADCHKHKGWQNFAAATAASASKTILERYIQTDKAYLRGDN